MKSIAVVLSLSAILASLAYISRDPAFKITSVIINGNLSVADRDLLSMVNEKLSGAYLYLFPKSNSILYPRKDIETSVVQAFKRIDKADIRFENLRAISLTVHEREQYALWCRKEGIESEDRAEECYFLDQGGFIFAEAPDFTGNVYFRFYGKLDNAAPVSSPVGAAYLEEAEFYDMTFFLDSLRNIGLKPVSISLNGEGDFETRLESGGIILFSRDRRLAEIFDNIESVFESEEFNRENLEELDYADFRFGNKTYFKFKR